MYACIPLFESALYVTMIKTMTLLFNFYYFLVFHGMQASFQNEKLFMEFVLVDLASVFK